jgi:shikimate kinase
VNVQDSKPIALIGLMGAGKTEVARRLGERLGVSVADLDAMLEAETGVSIAQQFEREGEAVFRRRETELLRRVLADGVRVIACGGGIVLDPAVRDRLRSQCRVVWLAVSPEQAASRLAPEIASRPLLRTGVPGARLRELLEAREALYRETAHHRVTTDGRDPGAVADDVLAALGARG